MRVNDSHTSLGVYGYQHFAQIHMKMFAFSCGDWDRSELRVHLVK